MVRKSFVLLFRVVIAAAIDTNSFDCGWRKR
jgi:hypothetical protein